MRGSAAFKRPGLDYFFTRRIGFALIASCLWIGQAVAENPLAKRSAIDFSKNGIRFQIKAAIRADPAAPYARQTYGRAEASLTVKLRISSHARETRFYGVTSARFKDFSLISGSAEMLFWDDYKCHQRRGLPKTTVVAIDGSVATDERQIAIHARPRHLGVLLPADEITQGIQIADRVAAIAFRSQSKASHLIVDVKIYASDCELSGAN